MDTWVVSIFYLLWLMLQRTWECRCLFKILISLPLDIYPEVRLLGHTVVLFLIYWGTSIHGGFTHLHTHQQCTSVPFSPHPCQHLSLDLLVIVLLTGIRWYLIVVFICISLMISDVDHLFKCPSTICVSFLEKGLCRSFVHFLIGLFIELFCYWVVEVFIYCRVLVLTFSNS